MTNAIDIQSKLLAVRLNCSFAFGRVTDKAITNETNNSKDTQALVVRKNLFPNGSGEYLKKLQGVLSAFYAYHAKVTMSGINEGERLLPVVFYMDYQQEYGAYQALVQEAYDDFVDNYDNAILQAQPLLKAAFNISDYPPKADLPKYLRFKVQTLPLPTAGPLLSVVGDCIQADVDGYLNEAVSGALADVNGRMKTALERMVKQLSDPKGKVYDSLTESIAELVSFIPSFNVTEDDSLSLLVEEVKQKLLPVGPDELRHDPVKRKATADVAMEILRRMGG